MRIRQVKPEFWKDRVMAEMAPATRLTYIGLWMLADDAGWLRLDAPEVALELYGWDDRADRETVVTAAIGQLVDADRLVVSECGRHANIPTLLEHQRFGGETKRVYTVKREHESCPRVPAGAVQRPAGITHLPDPERKGTERVGNGSSRNGSSHARKRDEDELTEFQRRVPRSAALS